MNEDPAPKDDPADDSAGRDPTASEATAAQIREMLRQAGELRDQGILTPSEYAQLESPLLLALGRLDATPRREPTPADRPQDDREILDAVAVEASPDDPDVLDAIEVSAEGKVDGQGPSDVLDALEIEGDVDDADVLDALDLSGATQDEDVFEAVDLGDVDDGDALNADVLEESGGATRAESPESSQDDLVGIGAGVELNLDAEAGAPQPTAHEEDLPEIPDDALLQDSAEGHRGDKRWDDFMIGGDSK